MNTKIRIIFGLFFYALTVTTMSQIKVFDDNFITLGSLSKGGYGFNMHPNGYSYFRPSIFVDYGWMNATMASCSTSKCYIIQYDTLHTFFVYGDGLITARDITLYSDSTLKKEIKTINSALSILLKLRGVSFRYKEHDNRHDTVKFKDKYGITHTYPPSFGDNGNTKYVKPGLIDSLRAESNRKNFGVIAQEVEKLVPDLVRTTPDGLKTVNYISIIGLMIESIKELQQKIDSLGGQMNSIENQIAILKETAVERKEKSIETTPEPSILFQNYPNPFSQKTTIKFLISNTATKVSLFIFNLQGTLLKVYPNLNNRCEEIVIGAAEFKPGMYIYTLLVDGKEIGTKRMILTD
jgi:hypothetical protein